MAGYFDMVGDDMIDHIISFIHKAKTFGNLRATCKKIHKICSKYKLLTVTKTKHVNTAYSNYVNSTTGSLYIPTSYDSATGTYSVTPYDNTTMPIGSTTNIIIKTGAMLGAFLGEEVMKYALNRR
jgi:hypothetical protein